MNVRVVQFDALVHGEYILTFRLENGDLGRFFFENIPFTTHKPTIVVEYKFIYMLIINITIFLLTIVKLLFLE